MSVTKQAIAETFARHVERFGYAKTTLDEVARELGISKKTLYVHFDGKSAIYAYLVERIAKQARREMAAAVAGLGTNAEKVTALVTLVLRQARGISPRRPPATGRRSTRSRPRRSPRRMARCCGSWSARGSMRASSR